ncbi:murein hydrolase activator EnvC family protein [Pseudalkalibacillus salsuginis]|uniref:murein hydrolase activator EnvC family protein n=1 Tax=Pseudalkalibacillus salsuginis TaxID=2910972 RepID=UPI001F3E236A|nr:peptidoglycan DD-metalloendopeptidase family protein [Pseudalkalibacillus salsuginis]MCF6410179.1 peptidoglycan DD-metalloendopeptidase family protein [Pseudalkalibacillus salsuginis]
MKRKFIAVAASVSLLIGGFNFTGGNEAHAESLKDKIDSVKEKREKNKSKREEAKKEIEKIKNNQNLLDAEIKKLDQQVADTQNNIDSKEKEIAKTKEEIEKLKAEIQETEKRIAERDEMLKDRVTAMYENGGSVQYIEVLLGSQNFGDFLDRVFALNEISKQDKQILEEHKADKKALEEMKVEIEQELADLQKQMKELQSLKDELDTQVKRKNALLSDLKEEEEHMHEEVGKLEDEADLLSKQQAAFEAEKRRQEEAARAAAKKKSSSSGDTASTPAVTGGMFMKPAAGRFTSGFGQRWGSMHPGIDIAQGGTVPVVASASGTVIKSYYSSSYGNVIFVAHYLNGQTYTSVYAHLRSRNVGNGASVKKGQQIGIMGNTGRSTGQHLHFEIHKGQWNQSKSNAIDPRQFF